MLLKGSEAVLKDSFISPGEVLGGKGEEGDRTVFPKGASTSVGTFAGGLLLAGCLAVLWMKAQGGAHQLSAETGRGTAAETGRGTAAETGSGMSFLLCSLVSL